MSGKVLTPMPSRIFVDREMVAPGTQIQFSNLQNNVIYHISFYLVSIGVPLAMRVNADGGANYIFAWHGHGFMGVAYHDEDHVAGSTAIQLTGVGDEEIWGEINFYQVGSPPSVSVHFWIEAAFYLEGPMWQAYSGGALWAGVNDLSTVELFSNPNSLVGWAALERVLLPVT